MRRRIGSASPQASPATHAKFTTVLRGAAAYRRQAEPHKTALNKVVDRERLPIRAMWLGVNGPISSDTIWFFVVGLPVLFVETWGLKLYVHLDEVGFRKIVLILLLLSGIALFVPAIAPSFARAVMSRHPPLKPSEVR